MSTENESGKSKQDLITDLQLKTSTLMDLHMFNRLFMLASQQNFLAFDVYNWINIHQNITN